MNRKILTLSIIMLVTLNAFILLSNPVYADENLPQWPDNWTLFDTDELEDSGKSYRDVYLANYSIDNAYIYFSLECYGYPNFTVNDKARYKWFIDIDNPYNMTKSGGSIKEFEYMLFIEDSLPQPGGDGIGEIFLLEDKTGDGLITKADYTDYLTDPGPILDTDVADFRIDGKFIEAYIKQTNISSPQNSYFTWATDQADPNLNSAPNLDRSEDFWDLDLQKADISVLKTVSSDPVNSGDTFSYTITVENHGPNDGTNISIEDRLPTGVNFLSSNQEDFEFSGSTYWWNFSSLEVSEIQTIIINVDTTEGFTDTVTNVVTAYNETRDPKPDNNYKEVSTTITYEVDLSLNKIDNIDPVHSGGSFSYILTVTNNGPNSAQNVNVTDKLPTGVTFLNSNPTANGNSELTYWWNIPTMANNEIVTITINAAGNTGFTGTVLNSANVVSDITDSNPSNNQASEETTFKYMVNLSVHKTDNKDPIYANENISYTIEVINHGPNVATNVNLTDNIPSEVNFVNAEPSPDGNSGTTYWWTFFSIDVGATEIIIVNVSTDESIKGVISNTAQVTCDTLDQTPIDNEDSEETTILNIADLNITKTANKNSVYAGDPLTYKLNITNYGPNTARNVNISDILPSEVTFLGANPSPNGSSESKYWWTLPILNQSESIEIIITVNVKNDIERTIVNTAFVESDTNDDTPENNVSSVQTTVEIKEKPPGGGGGDPPPSGSEFEDPTADAGGPYYGLIEEEIQFNGSKSHDNDEGGESIDEYDWKFFEGDEWHRDIGSTPIFIYNEIGVYEVTLLVHDDEGSYHRNKTTVTISLLNRPPQNLEIIGPNKGHQNTTYIYNISAIDLDDHNIIYTVEWGDGNSNTSDPVPNGTVFKDKHMWTAPGFYSISVTAVDELNAPSLETGTLDVLIDILFVKIIGHLIDEDSDGVYDMFYSNQTGNITVTEQLEDGRYLISNDDDDEWDWIYDPEDDTLIPYFDEKAAKEENNFLWYLLAILLLIILLAIILFLAKRKKDNEKAAKSNKTKGKGTTK